jgi:hypothetical protein
MTVEINDAATLAERWLVEAYELLEQGWCRDAPALDAAGDPVAPESPAAVAWSVPGALQRVWRTSGSDVELGLYAFQRANLALVAATGGAPGDWSGARYRSPAQVLEAVVVAISLVRSVAWRPDDAA